MEFVQLEEKKVGLVIQKGGRIIQIGLTPSQSNLLQSFLSEISKEIPLMEMGEEYDFLLKQDVERGFNK